MGHSSDGHRRLNGDLSDSLVVEYNTTAIGKLKPSRGMCSSLSWRAVISRFSMRCRYVVFVPRHPVAIMVRLKP